MNRSPILRAFAAALILCLSACAKTDDTRTPIVPTPTPVPPVTPPPTPPAGTGNSVYLSKVYMLDTTLAAPFDTLVRATYTYDAQKRPMKYEAVQRNAAGVIVGKYAFSYQYTGTDTLATKSTEEETEYTAGSPSGTTLSYKSYIFLNGKCIYDSSYGSVAGSYHTRSYTYLAGNVIQMLSRSKSTGAPTIYSSRETIRQVISNGNIVSQVDSSETLVPATPVSGSRLENTVAFISNPNPFARFSNPVRRPYHMDDIGIASTNASPKNLFTQHSYTYKTWSGATTNNNAGMVQYSYAFRADGYPTICWETFNLSGPVRTKFILVYE